MIGLLQHADTHVSAGYIRVAGVAKAGEEWSGALSRFRDGLDGGIEIDLDVYVIDTELSIDELCERMFSEVVAEPVSFRQSGTEIRRSSIQTLDRIADFARDCSRAVLTITGHSDATGNEISNVELSTARAQAVADYLVGRGISAERLIVAGAGSAEPIADNDTVHGRERNRRIEFGVSYPIR